MSFRKIRKSAVLRPDTKPVRLSWSSLFERTGTKFSSENLRYRAAFFVPRESDKVLSNFPVEWQEAYKEVLSQAFPKGNVPESFRSPFIDGKEKDRDWCREWCWLKATSGFQPKVYVNEKVMKNGKPSWKQISADEADEVYEGCWVIPKVEFSFYEMSTPGVNVYFKSLIRVAHDEPWGSGDFDDLEIDQESPSEALRAEEKDEDIPF